MIPTTIELALAGVWHYILHWGIGVALIICLLGAAYFTTAVPLIGPSLSGMRKDLCWAAFGVAVFLGGHVVGAKDATNRCVAQRVIVEKTVEKAVVKSTTPKSKAKRDRWDDPKN